MTQPKERKLSQEEIDRISHDFEYKNFKQILNTANQCKDFEVGSAVLIKNKDGSYITTDRYRSTTQGPPIKYIIIKNDDGVIFGKRVLKSGKEGVGITCLTIEYANEMFSIVPDEDYIDAMLLDEDYDPMQKERDFKKRKSKATRINNSKRLKFDTPEQAIAHIKTLKVGDKLWMAETTFGDRITELKVSNLIDEPTDTAKSRRWGHYAFSHTCAYKAGMPRVYIAECRMDPSSWRSTVDIAFHNICKGPEYQHHNTLLYSEKPVTPDEV